MRSIAQTLTLVIVPALAAGPFAPARADIVAGPIHMDMNGDGIAERFSLQTFGENSADLVIERTGGGVVFADRLVWVGGIGQQPDMMITPGGSLQITSRNDSIGRHRWTLTLTVAYRQGTYMLAGYSYAERDTLDLDAIAGCDFNLLTGRGTATIGTGPTTEHGSPFPAMPITQWRHDRPVPAICTAG